MTALVVLAKSPQPGRSKTRLCPPCSPEQAAWVAEAALRDTLDVAAATCAARVVLVLDGPPMHGIDDGIEVLPQRGDGLGERLAAAFADVDEPSLLVGMDTPQVTVELLDQALRQVERGTPVLGEAADGGWWALGLPSCPPGAFDGVPMSTATTCVHQRARLQACGVEPEPLPVLCDVDHWEEALAVATSAPDGRFAAVVRAVDRSASQVVS
jgi:rSAM/selenodomain-associated transferase 1